MRLDYGFTLVEILIAVALVAALAMVAVPMGSAWTSSAESVNTKGILTQALGRAKSSAMRNGNKITETNSAAAVCLSAGKIEVREAGGSVASAHCAANGGTASWSAKIGTSLAIKSNNQTLSCLCFSTRGQLITSSSNCSSCASSTRFEFIGTGIENETVSIY